jgi:hypothetical protein
VGAWRHPGFAVLGLGRPVVLVDGLHHDVAGQRVDVARVAQQQEVVELRQRADLADHRRPGKAVAALQRQEPVRVRRLGRPQGTGEEAGELEQHRPVVADLCIRVAGRDRSQQELVHQLLLEVLHVL